MRATLMYGTGDVRIETVPDSIINHPTDALLRITGSRICGSDLLPYHSMPTDNGPARMGHERINIVEDIGSDVTIDLNGVVAGYQYMGDRKSVELMIKPSPSRWRQRHCAFKHLLQLRKTHE